MAIVLPLRNLTLRPLAELPPGQIFYPALRAGHPIHLSIRLANDGPDSAILVADRELTLVPFEIVAANTLVVPVAFDGPARFEISDDVVATRDDAAGQLVLNSNGPMVSATRATRGGGYERYWVNLTTWEYSDEHPSGATTFDQWKLISTLAGEKVTLIEGRGGRAAR